MNLPSLVHGHPPHSQHQTHFSPMPGHGHRPEHSMLSSQHGHHHNHQQHYSHHEYHSHAPAPPPSPPVEDNSKCSLPSISTLLVYADCGPANSSGNGQQPSQSHSPSSSYHSQSSPHASHSRVTLPPTPPMRPDSVFEGSTNSPTLPAQTPSYFYSPSSSHRNSYPPAQQKSPVYSSPESPYPPPHQSSYYPPPPPPPPPQQQQPSSPSMGYGKSMPSHNPHMIPVSIAPPSASNPWHHHHHSSPASHAAFPQSQDRYICQTCNKAFSRPSSLRIHSHSHTGEKPFKCPHHGCGKAFSVRSNMKRHERGCHQ